jgi:hypothetical protein
VNYPKKIMAGASPAMIKKMRCLGGGSAHACERHSDHDIGHRPKDDSTGGNQHPSHLPLPFDGWF